MTEKKVQGPFGYFIFQDHSGRETSLLRSWLEQQLVPVTDAIGIQRRDANGDPVFKLEMVRTGPADSILWEATSEAHPKPSDGMTVEIFTIVVPSHLQDAAVSRLPERKLYLTAHYFSGHWYMFSPEMHQRRTAAVG
jgi:hypothetical protein